MGTAVKQMMTTMAPTMRRAVTRKRLTHLMTSGPPRAMNVPRITHKTPNAGFQKVGLSVTPKPANKLIMEEAKSCESTAYQPKFAMLITVAKMATPLMPRTDRSQTHRSMPYRTAKNTGMHSIKIQTMLKQKMLMSICRKDRYCAT